MKILRLLTLGVLIAAALTLVPAAHAQVTFTLAVPAQFGYPGDTIAYSGTLTNTGTSTVYINNDSPVFNTPPGVSLDDSPFFSVTPFMLTPGNSLTAELFDVSLASDAAPSTYQGTFQILGGVDAGAADIVASYDFSVQVLPAAVPELSSTVSFGTLLMLGSLGLLVAKRKKAVAS